MSAYKIETWLRKGYDLEGAKKQIAMRRPTNILYWINKGMSENDALAAVKEFSTRASKKNLERPLEERVKNSVRRVEYYLSRGYTEEESKRMVSDIQTRSLDKWTLQHGETEGKKIWEARQKKWQNTLKQKSADEISAINKKKGPNYNALIEDGKSHQRAVEIMRRWYKSHNTVCCESEAEFEAYVRKVFDDDPFLLNFPIGKLLKRFSKNNLRLGWKLQQPLEEWLRSRFELDACPLKVSFKNETNIRYGCLAWTKTEKLLRSSNEIYFYQLLESFGLVEDSDYEIEKRYPNSNMRSDFYFPAIDMHVELAGMNGMKMYEQKMLFKANTYGSIILKTKKEYKPFLEFHVNNIKTSIRFSESESTVFGGDKSRNPLWDEEN